MKKLFALVFVLFIASSAVLMAENTTDLAPKFWAYFQPQSEFVPGTQSFSISQARGYVVGNLTDKISYFVELAVVPSPTLIKANVSYNFGDYLKVTIGQQSSAFKFYNPDPCKRHLAVYPLSALNTPTDDLGWTFEGKVSLIEYRFSILNGTGINRKDDNKKKDLLAWAKISPATWLSLTGCWQGGYQGVNDSQYYRSGQWFQAELKPFSWLSVKPTWLKRNDLEKNNQGWFVLSQVQIGSHQLLVQYLSDYNSDKEWTVGGIISTNKRMRFLPSVFYRSKMDGGHDVGLYITTHINVGKDI